MGQQNWLAPEATKRNNFKVTQCCATCKNNSKHGKQNEIVICQANISNDPEPNRLDHEINNEAYFKRFDAWWYRNKVECYGICDKFIFDETTYDPTKGE